MTILLQLQSSGGGPRPGVFGSGRVLSPPSPTNALSRADSQQISLLFNQHGPRVYRRALRLLGNPADAEEATQEIFIRAFRSAGSFRQQSQMTTWLYQIATNYCLNLIRDRSRRTALHDEHVAPLADDASRPEPVRPDDVVLMRRLLADADERQAAAAVYVFLDGMSHEEAASVLGVSKRTVGNLLERFQEWVNARTAGGMEDTPPPPPAPPPPERKSSGFLGFGRRRS